VQAKSLFESVESFSFPFRYLVGTLNLSLDPRLADPLESGAPGDLCAYGLGQRRQYHNSGPTAGVDPCLALARHAELKAFAIEHSQQALGCELQGEDLQVNARRCLDQSDYSLSPHMDCPKTICAILVYLWTGQRGTSFYRLTGHAEAGPAEEPGLQERVNNFNGNKEYQRDNFDVITTIKPGCFAYFEHVTTIRPAFGSFLFIPNTRFRKAIPDLPSSYHGVASRVGEGALDEARDLILIDVKLSNPAAPPLRSAIKARFRQLLTQRPRRAQSRFRL
jgi:hypothetical protein